MPSLSPYDPYVSKIFGGMTLIMSALLMSSTHPMQNLREFPRAPISLCAGLKESAANETRVGFIIALQFRMAGRA